MSLVRPPASSAINTKTNQLPGDPPPPPPDDEDELLDELPLEDELELLLDEELLELELDEDELELLLDEELLEDAATVL